jgi:hypothetical protein
MYSLIGILASADRAAYGHALRPKGIDPNGVHQLTRPTLPVRIPDNPSRQVFLPISRGRFNTDHHLVWFLGVLGDRIYLTDQLDDTGGSSSTTGVFCPAASHH